MNIRLHEAPSKERSAGSSWLWTYFAINFYLLGRPRRRWEDNIKMDLQEVGGGCEDWMELAQDRDRWRALVNTVMNLRVSKMRGISWLAAEPVSFSRRTLLHGVSNYFLLNRDWRFMKWDWIKPAQDIGQRWASIMTIRVFDFHERLEILWPASKETFIGVRT